MRKIYKITTMALIFTLMGMILISNMAHPIDSGFINRLRVRLDDPRDDDRQSQALMEIQIQNILDKVGIKLEDLGEKLLFMYKPIFLPDTEITPEELKILLHYFWKRNGPEDLSIPGSLVDRVTEKRDILGAETLAYIAIGHIGGPCVRKIKGELDFPDDRVEEEAFLWEAFEIALPGISNKPLYLVNNDRPIEDMLERKKRSLKVLDLGCGPEGAALETLKEKHGDDIEAFGINLKITNKKPRHVKLVQGSLKNLRPHFEEDFFDLIYANTVLPYFVKDEEFIVAMREILSVLSPTGKIILLGNNLFERYVIEAQIGGFADLLGIDHNLTQPGIPGDDPIIITKKATYRSDPRLVSGESIKSYLNPDKAEYVLLKTFYDTSPEMVRRDVIVGSKFYAYSYLDMEAVSNRNEKEYFYRAGDIFVIDSKHSDLVPERVKKSANITLIYLDFDRDYYQGDDKIHTTAFDYRRYTVLHLIGLQLIYDLEGATVVDAGAGNGVMAIASALLGVEKVYVLDQIDDFKSLIEDNARQNGVLDKLDFTYFGEPFEELAEIPKKEEDVDIVLMNMELWGILGHELENVLSLFPCEKVLLSGAQYRTFARTYNQTISAQSVNSNIDSAVKNFIARELLKPLGLNLLKVIEDENPDKNNTNASFILKTLYRPYEERNDASPLKQRLRSTKTLQTGS